MQELLCDPSPVFSFRSTSPSARRPPRVTPGRLAAHFGSQLLLLHVLTPLQFEFGAVDISGYMLGDVYQNRAQQRRPGARRASWPTNSPGPASNASSSKAIPRVASSRPPMNAPA